MAAMYLRTSPGHLSHRHSIWLVLACGCVVGLLVSLWLAKRTVHSNQAIVAEHTAVQAEHLVDQLVSRIASYEKGLRGVRGAILVGGMEHMDAHTFGIYSASRDIEVEFPGAHGFGFIRRVLPEQEQEFLREVRSIVDPEFAIKQLSSHEGERWIIELIEPIARNRAARGLDIASEASRRKAALTSMHTGKATLTAPITILQASDLKSRSFLFMLPVYRPGLPLTSSAEREAATIGWTYAPLIMDEVLQALAAQNAALSLQIRDTTQLDKLPFYTSGAAALRGAAGWRRSLLVMGRQWQFIVHPSPEFVAQLQLPSPLSVFTISATLSLLLSALLAMLVAAAQRKRLLDSERALLASITENSTDAIVVESLDGRIVSWNKQAEHQFGYRIDEAVGQSLAGLIVPDDLAHEDASLLARAAAGLPIETFDTQRRHQDGSLVDVSIAVVPVRDGHGRTTLVANIVCDIRQRKLTELALKSANSALEHTVDARSAQLVSMQRFVNNMMNAVPSMMGYWDKQLINRFANKAYGDWFGKDPQSLAGTHISDLLGQALYQKNLPHLEAALGGVAQTFEREIQVADGSKRNALAHYMPDLVEGEVNGIYVLVNDITEVTRGRQQLAQVMRENEALLRTLNQHSLVSVADRKGKIISVNDAFCALSGYSREELLGQDHRIVNSGIHPRSFWHDMWCMLAEGEPWRGEVCNRNKHGDFYWVDSVISPFFDEHGKIIKYISIRTDITAIKYAQQRLAESEAALTLAGRVTNTGGFRTNLETGDRSWTRETYHLFEVENQAELTPELIEKLCPPEAAPIVTEAHRLAAVEGKNIDIEVPMLTLSGRPLCIRIVGEVELIKGKPTIVAGAIQDVTARHNLERELRKATAAAQRANVAKSEFLANMSHEIRTPLNAIIGLGYLLEQTSLSEEQYASLNKIQFAGRALLGVINNVLDLSKIEAGEMTIEKVGFDLSQLQREVIQMLAPQSQKKNVELLARSDANVPRLILGDATRLRQMFINLLSNALKFTDEGSVELHTSLLQQESVSVRLRFSVRDTGIGIAPEAIAGLFQSFAQADASTTRRFGGTGLGLSITRRFVSLMGGEIGVNSALGEGSEFWMELPLHLATASEMISDGQQRGLNILIGQSAGQYPKALDAIVQTLGWQTLVMLDGEAVLAKLRTTPRHEWPDVLLLESHLQDIAAEHFLARLSKEFPDESPPPCVVVTRQAVTAAELTQLSKVADMVLQRPITSSSMFNAISAAIAKRQDVVEKLFQSTNIDMQRARWLPTVRVLVADDSDVNLEVARRILEAQGATVTTRADGRLAVEYLREHGSETDIVLMDVQMPVMDGNAATEYVRNELGLKSLPILALTAGALVSERQRSLDSGMDDFLTKPFEPLTLIRLVRRHVERARGASLPIAISDMQTASTTTLPALSSIDAAACREVMGNDCELFETLLEVVLRDYADFALPISVQDLDKPARAALKARTHKFKGSSGTIGAMVIHRLAGAAERALIDEAPAELVEAILGQLAVAFTTLQEESKPMREARAARLAEAKAVATERTRVMTATEMVEFQLLLDNQDLAALDAFAAHANYLSTTLGAERFERLHDAVSNLEFQIALEVLRPTINKDSVQAVG